MRIDNKYKLLEIARETTIVSQGTEAADMKRIIYYKDSPKEIEAFISF